jgi:hypothetical protein
MPFYHRLSESVLLRLNITNIRGDVVKSAGKESFYFYICRLWDRMILHHAHTASSSTLELPAA